LKALGWLILFSLSLSAEHAYAKPLTLVREGKPAATIVTAADPPLVVQLAVAELNHYIEKITGTALPVADDSRQVEGVRVLVGESAATRALGLKSADFEKQEYLVQTRPDALIIIGRDADDRGKLHYENSGVWKDFSYFSELGTLYGVYDFLERCCGVRWYLPTEIGEVVPKRSTLEIDPVNIRRKPWAKYRWIGTNRPIPARLYQWDMSQPEALKNLPRLPDREVTLFWLRQRMGGEFFICNHSFYPWQKRFAKTHPEYFAINEDGTINIEQLNYASDAVVEQVVRDILACRRGEWNDENGIPRFGRAKENIFPLVPMDNRRWSCDPASQRLLLPEPTRTIGSFNTNRASRYIFQFVIKVAKRIAELDPEVIISALAYSEYYFPPEPPPERFPDNVAIMVCKQQVKARTTRYNKAYYDSLRKWRGKVKCLYIWEYYNFPQWRRMNVFPGLVPRRIGGDMRKLHELQIDGEFVEFNTARGFPPVEWWMVNPAMQHMNYYFTLKLLDTMERPVEELLDEYYRLFYGPAEKPMREFFTRIENTFMNEKYFRPGHLDAKQSWTVYCPPKKLEEFGKLIAEAKRRARGRHPYEERVQLMDEAIFQFMKTSSERFHTGAKSAR